VPITPEARRDAVNWVAHLALILAVATVTATLAGRSDSRPVRVFGLGIIIVLIVLFIAQSFRASRVDGPLGKGTAYALAGAGALCTLVARSSPAQPTAIALTIFGALFYVGGLVGFVIQIRHMRGSQ
jgi:hypothetical protein